MRTQAGALPVDPQAIDALLPQTQCQRCGYPSCRDYADAITHGLAEINRCPPGGRRTIERLSQLTGHPALELDPQCGEEAPWQVAVIEESLCIGCTLCIQVCPVDAIVGAAKRMHTVIESECTGCELCVPVCPMDCVLLESSLPLPAAGIEARAGCMRDVETAMGADRDEDFLSEWMAARAPLARRRYESRAKRLAHNPSRRVVRTRALLRDAGTAGPDSIAVEAPGAQPLLAGSRTQAEIEGALERSRARRRAKAQPAHAPLAKT